MTFIQWKKYKNEQILNARITLIVGAGFIDQGLAVPHLKFVGLGWSKN